MKLNTVATSFAISLFAVNSVIGINSRVSFVKFPVLIAAIFYRFSWLLVLACCVF